MGDEDKKELGGNISLSGFKDVEPAELIVVKKLTGSYARKFSDHLKGYESLAVHLKDVHKSEGSERFELHGKLVHDGKVTVSEITDNNLFVALDKVLKKLEAQVF